MTKPEPAVTPDVLGPAWNEPVREISERGLERDREATAEEKAALAAALDLVSVQSLRARYRIRPSAGGRYLLRGKLEATVEQTCVVSLATLTNKVSQELDVSFWPQADITPPAEGAVDLEDEAEPEPIEDGRLPVGRIIFETFAAAIDPFPRAPDAKLDWKTPEGDAPTPSPFAALARLKK